MTTDRIYVDGNLDLVIETDGSGASVGMMDRELVRARAADVLKALRQVAERDGADLSNVNVGIAGGTLSYADVEAMTATNDRAPNGWLCDSDTTDRLRPATAAERAESLAAGSEGHIRVDGRRCYVEL